MKLITRLVITTLISVPATVHSQLFFVGVRGGAAVPKGSFAEAPQGSESPLLKGAKPGLGYGLDAGLSLGPLLGLYAATDRIDFDCRPASCAASGKYKLKGASAGLRMGIPLVPLALLIKPWVRAGITVNQLTGTFNGGASGTTVTTEKRPGYELGGGVDLPVMTFFSITPQLRYVRQNLKYKPPASSGLTGSTRSADYYTFDLGFRFRSPI